MVAEYTRKKIPRKDFSFVDRATIKNPDKPTIVALVRKECIHTAPHLNDITEEEIGDLNFVKWFCYFNVRGKSARLKFAPTNHESFCILS